MSKHGETPVREEGERYTFPHLLMIAASAGTGKTHQLAKRYVQFILDPETSTPHNDISNILAITFTRKAAREMKERVLDHLKKLALGLDEGLLQEMMRLVQREAHDLPVVAAEKINQVIDRYTDFQVQTIDSFMNRIARSCALELGLAPDFEPTTSFDELRDYSLSLLLNRVGPGRDPDITRMFEDFLRVLNRLGGRYAWNPEQELLNEFTRLADIEAKETGTLFFGDPFKMLEGNLETVRRVYEDVTSPPVRKRPPAGFEEALEEENLSGITGKYNPDNPPIYKPGIGKDLYEEKKKQWASLAEPIAGLSVAHALLKHRPYAAVFGEFRREMEAARQRTGTIALGDMTKELNQYIKQEIIPDIYLRLGQRLYHFLIDEFQDTNPVQWENLYPLITESLSKDGSLFLVGDLKQAIYMFRSADYKIMRKLLREIEGEETDDPWVPPSVRDSSYIRPLEINYRSGEVILDYVAQLFKHKLKTILGSPGFRKDLTRLTDFVLEPAEEKRDKGYVEVVRFSEDRDEKPSRSLREHLLEIIQDLVNRNYDYRDIAVLSGKNRDLEVMLDWLTASGVPATASSSVDIRKRKVVNEVIQLLKFLDSPVDNVAFAGFITGDIMRRVAGTMGVQFGMPEFCELAVAARSGGSEYLYQKFKESSVTERIWDECFEDIYQKTGYYPLYDLLTLALVTFRVFENFPGESGSLIRLLEMVNNLGAAGSNSIRDFLLQAADGRPDAFSLELPEYANAVQLLTCHKSKGLGFPVVINVINESGGGTSNTCYEKENGKIRIYHIVGDTRRNSPFLERIWTDRSIDDQIQWLNALYVAATRAKWEMYNLVVPRKKNSPYVHLFEECRTGKKIDLPEGEKMRIPRPLTVRLLARPGAVKDTDRTEDWSYDRWVDTRRGELYHEILEDIEFAREPIDKEVEKAMAGKRRVAGPADDIESTKKNLVRFLSHPEVREWFRPKTGREVYREKDFIDSSGKLMRMDRVVEDADQVTVIDFKTGEHKDYSQQLGAYKSLLEQFYGDTRIRAYIAYVDSGRIEELV